VASPLAGYSIKEMVYAGYGTEALIFEAGYMLEEVVAGMDPRI